MEFETRPIPLRIKEFHAMIYKRDPESIRNLKKKSVPRLKNVEYWTPTNTLTNKPGKLSRKPKYSDDEDSKNIEENKKKSEKSKKSPLEMFTDDQPSIFFEKY